MGRSSKKRGDVGSQKIKLLKLMDLLRRTSDNFSLPTEDIRRRLEGMRSLLEDEDDESAENEIDRVGIACHRHTLVKDIEAMSNYGYDVENTGELQDDGSIQGITDREAESLARWKVKRTRANRYYLTLGDRLSNSELRLIEMSLESSQILDDYSKDAIVKKLRSQTLDSHVYDYVENVFVGLDSKGRPVKSSQLTKEPQNRSYYWVVGDEKLPVGDTCRGFVSHGTDEDPGSSLSSDELARIIDPIEEGMLSGSVISFSMFDRDIENKAILRGRGDTVRRYEVYPLAFTFSEGKPYLLAAYKSTFERLTKVVAEKYEADIEAGRLDKYVHAFRLDSIAQSGLRGNCEPKWDDEYAITIKPQIKRHKGKSKAKAKKHTQEEREYILTLILRMKKWLSERQNFDSLLRRNPRMYFEHRYLDDEKKNECQIVLSFNKYDYSVLRALRDKFGSLLHILDDDGSNSCRVAVTVHSKRIFAQWLAGFVSPDGNSKLRILTVDKELQDELRMLQFNCLRCLYGGVIARDARSDQLAQEITTDSNVDVHRFLDQLTGQVLDSRDRNSMRELYFAMADCMDKMRQNNVY